MANSDETWLKRMLAGAAAVVGFVWAAPTLFGCASVTFLLGVALVGLFMGMAEWVLQYALMALGVYVVFVLVLRWLNRTATPVERGLDIIEPTRSSSARLSAEPTFDEELNEELELELQALKERQPAASSVQKRS